MQKTSKSYLGGLENTSTGFRVFSKVEMMATKGNSGVKKNVSGVGMSHFFYRWRSANSTQMTHWPLVAPGQFCLLSASRAGYFK